MTTKHNQPGTTQTLVGVRPTPAPAPGGGTPGPGGGGTPPSRPDPEAGTLAPIFGQPDFVPEYVFIVGADGDGDGFLESARQYYDASGIPRRNISSIENLLELLDNAGTGGTGTGILNRICIVSHVAQNTNIAVTPTHMLLPFLAGGRRWTLQRHFDGFGRTPIDALKAVMTLDVGTSGTQTYFINPDSPAMLMGHLRPAHNVILNQVPVDPFGDPQGEFAEFFRIVGSKWAARRHIADVTVRSTLEEAYDMLLADVMSRLRTAIPEAQLNTLRDAMLALILPTDPTPGFQPFGNSPEATAAYPINLRAAITAIQGNTFTPKLNRARQRFDGASKIDIRGCQVGRDLEYLRAVQRFFGRSATVRPTVSGPEWFQHYVAFAFQTRQSNPDINNLFNSGFGPYNQTRIRQFFNPWAAGVGIDDAHMAVWQTTLGLNALVFTSLQWRSSLPTTRIPVPRLQAFATGNFRETVGRLTRTFLPPAADVPTNAQLTAVDPVVPNAATWASQLAATVADTDPLPARFNELRTIYEGVDNRFTSGGGSPPVAQQVIPAAPPPGLNAQSIRDFQAALRTFIDTHTNSRLRPIREFLDACRTHAQDPQAKMRYYLTLGLSFLVYNGAAAAANANVIIMFEDTAGTDRRQNDAVRFWLRAQWRGVIPATLGQTTTFANHNSWRSPWLVETRQNTVAPTVPPFAFSPTDEYFQHIIIVTP